MMDRIKRQMNFKRLSMDHALSAARTPDPKDGDGKSRTAGTDYPRQSKNLTSAHIKTDCVSGKEWRNNIANFDSGFRVAQTRFCSFQIQVSPNHQANHIVVVDFRFCELTRIFSVTQPDYSVSTCTDLHQTMRYKDH